MAIGRSRSLSTRQRRIPRNLHLQLRNMQCTRWVSNQETNLQSNEGQDQEAHQGSEDQMTKTHQGTKDQETHQGAED